MLDLTPLKHPVIVNEWKVFDPRDSTKACRSVELVDASVIERDGQWCLFLAGQPGGCGATDIYSATLDIGVPLGPNGWKPTRNVDGVLVPVAARDVSQVWDGGGGRHCPCYAPGWDPGTREWVERIYYAGAAENIWGPYAIGYLEWNGTYWIDQVQPAFVASEDWERGSVYEPNLIYHEGKWRMWYVAGSSQEDYLVHCYSESEDGRTGWRNHAMFAPAEMKMFDFCVRQRGKHFEAIFSRVWLKGGIPPQETGLWWCRANQPSPNLSDWGEAVQIMTGEDRGWHSGPWKPSIAFGLTESDRAFVFFDGAYRTSDPGPFPLVLTLGCSELVFQ
jgi:hypothetical protein